MYDKVQEQLEGIRKEQENAPMITSKLPFESLKVEFEGNQNFLSKIEVKKYLKRL